MKKTVWLASESDIARPSAATPQSGEHVSVILWSLLEDSARVSRMTTPVGASFGYLSNAASARVAARASWPAFR